MFYVGESTTFEESRCFACMGAPLLQAAGPSISRAAELMSVLAEREATFWVWPGSRLFGLPSWARQGVGPRRGPMPNLVHPSVWLGASWGPVFSVLLLKCVFYADESAPFEESRCFARMGTPLLQAARPSISRAAELMSVLPERAATFWGGLACAYSGCPVGLGKGRRPESPRQGSKCGK
jgi:hypothetical protein